MPMKIIMDKEWSIMSKISELHITISRVGSKEGGTGGGRKDFQEWD